MQIYGDNQCQISIARFASELLSRSEVRPEPAALRALLIACGQLEQLVWDTEGAEESSRASAHRATDCAAGAFYSAWSLANPGAPPAGWRVDSELQQLRAHVAQI